ncbi:MAG: hypothetical protein HQK89_05230 [Nitrospirae bacterium]|nr:hypothetical protein [Nitrospirota bacterium]
MAHIDATRLAQTNATAGVGQTLRKNTAPTGATGAPAGNRDNEAVKTHISAEAKAAALRANNTHTANTGGNTTVNKPAQTATNAPTKEYNKLQEAIGKSGG